MGRAARYRRILALVASTMLTVVTSFSQTPADVVPKKPVALKFAELGATESCEFREGMRGFMDALSNKPGYQGYIVNYGTNHEIGRRERLITNRIAFRNFDRARITLVRGGYLSKPATEVWLIPPGADNPEISGGGEEPPLLNSVIEPYAVDRFNYVIDEFLLESIRTKDEEEQEKVMSPGGTPDPDSEEAETSEEDDSSDDGPKAWYDTPRFQWVAVSIAKRLATHKGTTGVIIFYVDDRIYDITKLTRFVEEGRDLLAKEGRISRSRLEVKFGGYRETSEVEFWVLEPQDAYPRLIPDERCPDSEKK